MFATSAMPDVHPEWTRVPTHLAFQLRVDSAYVSEPAYDLAYRRWPGRFDANVARTCQTYADSRLERAAYEAKHGRTAEATARWREALAFDPKIRVEDVGPLPLGVDHDVLRAARFFRELNAAALVSANR